MFGRVGCSTYEKPVEVNNSVVSQTRATDSMSRGSLTHGKLYGAPEYPTKDFQVVDEEKEGLKRIVGKYESPENLRIEFDDAYTDMSGSERCSVGQIGASGMSDASSDISDATSNWTPTTGVANHNFAEGVTEQDIMQVEMFYRSHKTEVTVCRCLANVYQGSVRDSGSNKWEFFNTGIPLLLLDSGEHHRQRKLYIVLAEKGTGFVLWKDVIDTLTNYTAPHNTFHTMHLSSDHTRQVGFSFDDGGAASEFFGSLSALTSNPEDDLFNLSKSKKKKKQKEKSKPAKQKYKAPKKADISQPCCFVHVTKLEKPELFPPPPNPVSAEVTNHKLSMPRSDSSELSDSTSQSEHSK
ncbi:uncharacterized protein LOC121370524 [Gigantopelta aegis]|uniref:uncharacterized protein LOC121370524 n=1 Tax=Gigantopelta aegis TaxID=1735272 RepID=UPI001B88C84A|nr:uncharacterized protein LOC121370524 [Gigantopelta aegis]XP_041351741.1 uncharacterized protein LOC121370524 [Gigantopelta aegis]XP_041351742.1 uncharacterized protein LOC121370524 [Gigantopelta aegis]XP_041351744.1 uncharacterized protein LOC121370524 [Gigantopelta aegis]XP_041351745.1 uncharacterized protein LOC121370524 [Gigantopelta aegis]